MIVVNPDNEVELYYNGSPKLETTDTGIKVTGTQQVLVMVQIKLPH